MREGDSVVVAMGIQGLKAFCSTHRTLARWVHSNPNNEVYVERRGMEIGGVHQMEADVNLMFKFSYRHVM